MSSEVAVAVAVFQTRTVKGEAVATKDPRRKKTLKLRVRFSKVPKGLHGFHIHTAGDLRGKGCKGACDHYHVGKPSIHGAAPHSQNTIRHHSRQKRHTGDLGNIWGPKFSRTYKISNIQPHDLWGRALIVHADKDDLGKGSYPDSKTTGHSGKRIACAIFGRGKGC